jgi:ComF family protein
MNFIIDVLLPRRCPSCKTLVAITAPTFCNDCRSQIKFSDDKGEGSLFLYGGLVRELILNAKFKPDESISRILSRFLAQTLRKEGDLRILAQSFDLVTYVPSHFRRRLTRGHELPALLAQSIATVIKRPLKHLLVCSRFDPPLSAAPSALERLSQVEGRYRLAKTNAKPSRILLVDDVVTTGATLQSAANVLIMAGHEASTFAFAKTSKC